MVTKSRAPYCVMIGTEPAVARADVVGEEREEEVAVHLVEVAAQRGRGDERVVALVERIEVLDA